MKYYRSTFVGIIWWLTICFSIFFTLGNIKISICKFEKLRERTKGMDKLYTARKCRASIGIFIEECDIENMGRLYYPNEPETSYIKRMVIEFLEMRMFPIKCIKEDYNSSLTKEEAEILQNRSLKMQKARNTELYYINHESN